MPRTPRRLQQKAWDATSARYASLDHPEWKLMDRLPAYFWEDQHNHKRYMQWLGKELGYSKPEDWYLVTSQDFVSRRGSGVLVVTRNLRGSFTSTQNADDNIAANSFYGILRNND